jgi:hypothetical protein
VKGSSLLHVYTQAQTWELGIECERQGWKEVITLPSREIYELKDKLLKEEGRVIFGRDELFACCNRSQRPVYALLKWHDTSEEDGYWEVVGKCLASSWYGACDRFGVPGEEGQRKASRVLHYSDLYSYMDNVLATVDEMALTHGG